MELKATLGAYRISIAKSAAEVLMRLRSAIDALPRTAAQLVAAAVVEALPRTPGRIDRDQLISNLRVELEAAMLLIRNEKSFGSIPQRLCADASGLATHQLEFDSVITDPPSLNFASYSSPVAAWFLGVRRERRRQAPDAFGKIKQALGPGASRVVHRLQDKLSQIAAHDPRMARIAMNYFAEMASVFAAVTNLCSNHAIFAMQIHISELNGVRVNTDKHLQSMLEVFGFQKIDDPAVHFTVMRRNN
jgi:hypothetical protein